MKEMLVYGESTLRINTRWSLQDKAISQVMENWTPPKHSCLETQASLLVSRQRQARGGQGALGEGDLFKYITVKEGAAGLTRGGIEW